MSDANRFVNKNDLDNVFDLRARDTISVDEGERLLANLKKLDDSSKVAVKTAKFPQEAIKVCGHESNDATWELAPYQRHCRVYFWPKLRVLEVVDLDPKTTQPRKLIPIEAVTDITLMTAAELEHRTKK